MSGSISAPRLGHRDWLRVTPFLAMHAACLAVWWVVWRWIAVTVAPTLYAVRGLGLAASGDCHSAHRSFTTFRWIQFLGAVVGNSAGQRGPIRRTAHHRRHPRSADTHRDIPSPRAHRFLWTHMLWFMEWENDPTRNILAKEWIQILSKMGLMRDLKQVPHSVLRQRLIPRT